MKPSHMLLLLLLLITGVQWPSQGADGFPANLLAARQNFQTKLLPQKRTKEPVDVPPPNLFVTVKYPTTNGPLAAYLTPDPRDGKKHPAIIWITGGDCNSIGDVWSAASPDDDQTAAAYRKAGIIMMFPSLRGGNDNPGVKEGFFGEVDDVVAAAKFLQQQPYVDPKRVYLGGHSTGGTLALLVAECSSLFRAVFSFGPVGVIDNYPGDFVPIDFRYRREVMVRSPLYWLGSIQSPTWVLEGTGGNIQSLRTMVKMSKNSRVRFVEVQGADHFNVLAPINKFMAGKIFQDTNSVCNISFTIAEVNRAFAASRNGTP